MLYEGFTYAEWLSVAEEGTFAEKPLLREQAASLTPEVYEYLRRTFKDMKSLPIPTKGSARR
ncbi:hypothetical protein ACH4FX_41580 [Streptomyces sp. NPDC018019]|uniref:hypothetical protein n=1 Tax=Streptomyces sp. NPDC018019 TaxID=3365030 RepID=UPI0037A0EC78